MAIPADVNSDPIPLVAAKLQKVSYAQDILEEVLDNTKIEVFMCVSIWVENQNCGFFLNNLVDSVKY